VKVSVLLQNGVLAARSGTYQARRDIFFPQTKTATLTDDRRIK
jgi:hypothetical protein